MKKNVAGQKVGAQMVSATDGSNFTGSVTVYVTLDAGTQAVGSVGSGACTHEGQGYHTYAPAQAETNGDLAAFTFVGTGAVSATVQVYTTFPQTGDAFATATAIETDTQDIQSRIPAALVSGRMDSSTGAMAANVMTAAAAAADLTTELQSGLATAAAVSTLQANVDDLPTNAGLAMALGTADDAVLAAIATTDGKVDGIKAKTDSLTFTVANVVDANIQRINDVAITGDGSGTPFGV